MSIRVLLVLFVIFTSYTQAQKRDTLQPYSPYWFIDELLQWNPKEDKDAEYNRSFTPLAKKCYNPEFKLNQHSRANEARVEVLPIFANTSGNPSQGSLDSSYYAFTYWQYVDLMVFWGGSSGEGIILAPNSGVVDAAHRNGVPVYGTVFFPPIVYGGKREWLYEFVQKDGDSFPVADKLIQVANYYGFDGWFINQETGNVGEVKEDVGLAKDMQEFMLYYKRKSNLSLQWYDAMMKDGRVKWQHELNSTNEMFFQKEENKVADQMFLDFRYTKDNLENTKKKTDLLGRNIYDIFGGIDIQINGYETKPGYSYPKGANFDVLFPEGQPHAASLAFYVPSWTFSKSNSLQDFYKRESRFWVGENGDPRNTKTDHNWKGVAHYVPAKSVVEQIPFVTNFCTGHGFKFFSNGVDITSESWKNGWNNLSLQDVQPTWRWVIEGKDHNLKVDYDFTDAYIGGSCLKFEGSAGTESVIPLYSTQIKITEPSLLTVKYKNEGFDKVEVVLTFENGDVQYLPVSFSQSSVGNVWDFNSISLKRFIGKKILRIAIKISSNSKDNSILKIGQLGIIHDEKENIPAPQNLQVVSSAKSGINLVNARIKWNQSKFSEIYYYSVYKIEQDGSKIFLGATTSNACFLPLIPKKTQEKIKIGVEAIGKDFSVSPVSFVFIE